LKEQGSTNGIDIKGGGAKGEKLGEQKKHKGKGRWGKVDGIEED